MTAKFVFRNPRKIQQAKNRFEVARYDNSYPVVFGKLILIYGLVVKARSSELGDRSLIPTKASTLCRPSAILRGTEPVSALTRTLLLLLSNFFLS